MKKIWIWFKYKDNGVCLILFILLIIMFCIGFNKQYLNPPVEGSATNDSLVIEKLIIERTINNLDSEKYEELKKAKNISNDSAVILLRKLLQSE